MTRPTIGIEIEVNWSSYFPKEYQQWFDNGKRKYRDFTQAEMREFDEVCHKLDEGMLPKLEQVSRELGLTRGKDAYWEFVFPPVFKMEDILSRIETLVHQGLLPLGIPHSLHITIADLTLDSHSSQLATWLEIISGVGSERIQQGVHSIHANFAAGWARRGNRGIRKRPEIELALGAKKAVEFRSPILPNSLSNIRELLEFSQRFGSVVCDIQNNISGTTDLQIWKELGKLLETTLISYHLDPSVDWGNPHSSVDIWKQYGIFLDSKKLTENLRKQAKLYLYQDI